MAKTEKKYDDQRPFDRSDWQMILLYNVWFWASIVLVVMAMMRG